MPTNRYTPTYDPNQATQPFQTPTPGTAPASPQSKRAKRKRTSCLGCVGCLTPLLIVLAVLAVYLLAPMRTNLLLLGADRTEGQETFGRTDTIILMTVLPTRPYVGMLSIPRDLWVPIPGHGENRINTAHFFAELDQPGSGPAATAQVIQNEFHVVAPYFVRIQFSGFKDVVAAMGGVDVTLSKTTANLPAGKHHLDGDQALAFVRERKSADDFFRMEDGQILMKAAFQQMLNPAQWWRLPQVYLALSKAVQTNVPIWEWPRLGMALLRVGPQGIDSRSVNREMVTPFITSGGADVLGPNWDKIRPVVSEMFGAE